MKRKIIGWLNIIISPLIIFFVYLSGYSIVGDLLLPLLGNILKPEVINSINSTTAKVALDTAILNLLINFIILKLLNLIQITVKITNKDRTAELYIPINAKKTKTVEINIQVKYRWNWIKYLANYLGNNILEIYIPNKINYQIKNREDLNANSIKDKDMRGVLKLILEECLDTKETHKEIYLLLEITATPQYLVNKSICTSISCAPSNVIKRIVLCLSRIMFMDVVLDEHSIRGRNI